MALKCSHTLSQSRCSSAMAAGESRSGRMDSACMYTCRAGTYTQSTTPVSWWAGNWSHNDCMIQNQPRLA